MNAPEAALRMRLYEIDTAMDAVCHEANPVPRLTASAEERQEVRAQLDVLLPPGEMGYHRNEDQARADIHFMPAPVTSGGAGT